jgi:hypothetical protein
METIIKVKKVCKWSDYFREYYQGIETKRYYCKVEFRGNIQWFTTDGEYGEPDCNVKEGIIFEIVD